jgi:hypothetical protein
VPDNLKVLPNIFSILAKQKKYFVIFFQRKEKWRDKKVQLSDNKRFLKMVKD